MNAAQLEPKTNGAHAGSPDGVDLAAVAEALQEDATVGYRPLMPLEAMWAGNPDMPQVTLRRDLEFMQLHPVVVTALEYYRGGIAGAEFWGGPDHANPDNKDGKPISPDPSVSQFILAHVERFWQRGVPMLQEGYAYGWAPGEHIYKESSGKMVWSHLKDFHPNDAFFLTSENRPVGVRVKNIKNKQPTDLWFASGSIPAKACWYAHRPRFGSFYGRSQLLGAWLPWRMLGWRDGMDQVINAAVYRAGYVGPVVGHPSEDMQSAQTGAAATRLDGQGNPRRSARDVARQMIEYAKAGAGFTKSTAKYPTAMGGGDKWTIEFPDHVMDVRPLIEAARWLEDRILLGIGVPPELVKAGGTGSGYSGRSIPREAFLDGQQKVADAMLQMFVEQVIRPLVLWNYGDIPFNVQAKPLLKTQTENKQGQPQSPLPQPAEGQEQVQPGGGVPGQPDPKRSQAMKDSWAKRKGSQGGQDGALSLSLEPEQSDRVLSIVRRVMARRAS